jgi:C4-dicarboxylate transporter
MNATTNEARLAGLNQNTTLVAESESARLVNYNVLNELPVAIFGIITIAYIVSSLLALA